MNYLKKSVLIGEICVGNNLVADEQSEAALGASWLSKKKPLGFLVPAAF